MLIHVILRWIYPIYGKDVNQRDNYWLCIYVHMYIYICTYIYIYMYIYIYICVYNICRSCSNHISEQFALLFFGSGVVFLCAVCTYFELKKQLKSWSWMPKHTNMSLSPGVWPCVMCRFELNMCVLYVYALDIPYSICMQIEFSGSAQNFWIEVISPK